MTNIAKLIHEIRALGPVPTEDEDDGLRILPPAPANTMNRTASDTTV